MPGWVWLLIGLALGALGMWIVAVVYLIRNNPWRRL
jgi:hypothetical protein